VKFENSPMSADLAQQHKQNEQIRKSCKLQHKTMALQRATMEIQQRSGATRSREDENPGDGATGSP